MPIPPETVQRAAQRGLDLREEFGRGGTDVGIARARDLSNGSNISRDTLRRMKAFFDRHESNKDTPPEDGNGKIAWLLWGGDAGRRWAESQLGRMEKASFSVGDTVRWNSSGGRAEGRITRIVRSGTLDVPGSSFTLNASEQNPAALIRVLRDGEPTDTLVGHRLATLSKISMTKQETLQATEIVKVDESLGLVFGFAIVSKIDGQPYFDSQGDHIPDEAVLKAGTDFFANARVAKEMHRGDQIGEVVFGFPLTEDIAKSLAIESRAHGLLIAMRPGPEVLAKFKDGTYTGFSIGGARITDEEVG